MTAELRTVPCAQYRYTWAERRLDGRGAGFGVVLRSRDWPADLVHDHAGGGSTDLGDLLTNLSAAARRDPGAHDVPQVAHLRVAGGSLLVAKRAVGTDGAGRPGNYCVHALFDPTGTLGSLDLASLVEGGVFRLERDVDAEPDGEAGPVRVTAPARWPGEPGSGGPGPASAPAAGPYGGGPLRPQRFEDWSGLLTGLTLRLPADLVNRLDLDATDDLTTPLTAGPIDEAVSRFAEAVELGIGDHDVWWQRLARPVPDWEHEAERFVMMTQPVRKVSDDWLWARWDEATARGRTLVANELLRRPAMSRREGPVGELQRRPELLDALIDSGVRGSARSRTGAARWIAAAGDDGHVVELAAELVGTETGLPEPLRARLQARPPAELPEPVARAVAEQLEGAEPMAAEWRRECLGLFLADLPSCAHAEELARASSDDDLLAALRARPAEASVETAWRRLAAALPAARAAALFARADPETAEALLRRSLAVSGTGAGPSQRLLPQLARTLDWADWPGALVTRLGTAEQTLLRQRRALLIAVAVLLAAVAVLAVLLAVLPGPAAQR